MKNKNLILLILAIAFSQLGVYSILQLKKQAELGHHYAKKIDPVFSRILTPDTTEKPLTNEEKLNLVPSQELTSASKQKPATFFLLAITGLFGFAICLGLCVKKRKESGRKKNDLTLIRPISPIRRITVPCPPYPTPALSIPASSSSR